VLVVDVVRFPVLLTVTVPLPEAAAKISHVAAVMFPVLVTLTVWVLLVVVSA
jgi:hypothetical protein